LLRDPILTVRIDAARALAAVPKDRMSSSDRSDFERAFGEYVQSLLVDADRAEAHLGLANAYAEQGDLARAEKEYGTALELVPAMAGAYANLADLYRAEGRDADAEKVLREGLRRAPRDAGLHHALGLTLVRRKRTEEALLELEKAATLPPERARYVYVYAVALDSTGQTKRALEVLASAHGRHAGNRDILLALASISAKSGDLPAASAYARKLLDLDPEDAEARRLVDQLAALEGKRQ
jgi:Flp pilus assembly protein TadD